MSAVDEYIAAHRRAIRSEETMIRRPHIKSFRLDEETWNKVRERFGPNRRLKSLSAFIREGIELRLKREDPWTGWQVQR
jgi:hypothetical protein